MSVIVVGDIDVAEMEKIVSHFSAYKPSKWKTKKYLMFLIIKKLL
jgi:predicted Zn-dependent peptidase